MNLLINYEVYTTQKDGNLESENEDACWPSNSNTFFQTGLSCAISDGATQTIFSKLWANLLVKSISYSYPLRKPENLQRVIDCATNNWNIEIKKKSLAWNQEEKVKQGASATLTWLKITNRECRVLSIGDSNLFIFRDKKLSFPFPISNSHQFSNHPFLISSCYRNNQNIEKHLRFRQWDWKPGDVIVMATDALSCYLLTEHEECKDIFKITTSIKKNFVEKIIELRSQRKIKNDDTTMIFLQILDFQDELVG